MTCEKVNTVNMAHLLQVFTRPGTLFLVGAGASARLFPNYREQAKCNVLCRQKIGYTMQEDDYADTRRRIVERAILPDWQWKAPDLGWIMLHRMENVLNNPGDGVIAMLLARIPNSAVQALHLFCSTPVCVKPKVPEYEVFRMAQPSVIATTNYDGLAARICRQYGHTVLPLHGRVPSDWARNPFSRQLIRDCFESGRRMDPCLRYVQDACGLWLPRTEEKSILDRPVYRVFENGLRTAERLVVIGYAFGGQDDEWTLKTVRKQIGVNLMSVTVIDPWPEEVLDSLTHNTKVQEAIGIKASWAPLSEAITGIFGGEASSLHSIGHKVACHYFSILDRVEKELDTKRKWQCEHCPLRKEMSA